MSGRSSSTELWPGLLNRTYDYIIPIHENNWWHLIHHIKPASGRLLSSYVAGHYPSIETAVHELFDEIWFHLHILCRNPRFQLQYPVLVDQVHHTFETMVPNNVYTSQAYQSYRGRHQGIRNDYWRVQCSWAIRTALTIDNFCSSWPYHKAL